MKYIQRMNMYPTVYVDIDSSAVMDHLEGISWSVGSGTISVAGSAMEDELFQNPDLSAEGILFINELKTEYEKFKPERLEDTPFEGVDFVITHS